MTVLGSPLQHIPHSKSNQPSLAQKFLNHEKVLCLQRHLQLQRHTPVRLFPLLHWLAIPCVQKCVFCAILGLFAILLLNIRKQQELRQSALTENKSKELKHTEHGIIICQQQLCRDIFPGSDPSTWRYLHTSGHSKNKLLNLRR